VGGTGSLVAGAGAVEGAIAGAEPAGIGSDFTVGAAGMGLADDRRGVPDEMDGAATSSLLFAGRGALFEDFDVGEALRGDAKLF